MQTEIRNFLEKIDYEGGAYGALDYGLRAEDYVLPKDLVDSWEEIRSMFRELDSAVEEFYGEAYRRAEELEPED
jgi:hypothetical protein